MVGSAGIHLVGDLHTAGAGACAVLETTRKPQGRAAVDAGMGEPHMAILGR